MCWFCIQNPGQWSIFDFDQITERCSFNCDAVYRPEIIQNDYQCDGCKLVRKEVFQEFLKIFVSIKVEKARYDHEYDIFTFTKYQKLIQKFREIKYNPDVILNEFSIFKVGLSTYQWIFKYYAEFKDLVRKFCLILNEKDPNPSALYYCRNYTHLLGFEDFTWLVTELNSTMYEDFYRSIITNPRTNIETRISLIKQIFNMTKIKFRPKFVTDCFEYIDDIDYLKDFLEFVFPNLLTMFRKKMLTYALWFRGPDFTKYLNVRLRKSESLRWYATYSNPSSIFEFLPDELRYCISDEEKYNLKKKELEAFSRKMIQYFKCLRDLDGLNFSDLDDFFIEVCNTTGSLHLLEFLEQNQISGRVSIRLAQSLRNIFRAQPQVQRES